MTTKQPTQIIYDGLCKEYKELLNNNLDQSPDAVFKHFIMVVLASLMHEMSKKFENIDNNFKQIMEN